MPIGTMVGVITLIPKVPRHFFPVKNCSKLLFLMQRTKKKFLFFVAYNYSSPWKYYTGLALILGVCWKHLPFQCIMHIFKYKNIFEGARKFHTDLNFFVSSWSIVERVIYIYLLIQWTLLWDFTKCCTNKTNENGRPSFL